MRERVRRHDDEHRPIKVRTGRNTLKTGEEAQRQCDSWNSLHPVGSAVLLYMDSGEIRRTRTRSEAYVCNSGYPVIFLEGVSGYYLLKRVERTSENGTRDVCEKK